MIVIQVVAIGSTPSKRSGSSVSSTNNKGQDMVVVLGFTVPSRFDDRDRREFALIL